MIIHVRRQYNLIPKLIDRFHVSKCLYDDKIVDSRIILKLHISCLTTE